MFLRNCWYVAAWENELPAGNPIGRKIIGEPVVIFRDQGGAVHALEDRCAHRRAPLSMGRLEGDNIRCMYHGLLFGSDGICRQVPGSEIIPPRAHVRKFPVMIQDSWIWVWMGDPKKADTTLCPAAFGFDNPEWRLRGDQIDYRANHLLLSDNLCDLSHLDFVHETTLGLVTGGGWSAQLPRIIQLERGLRFERWHVGRPTSPSNPTLLDTWSTYNYSVPGIFVMENMSFPHGMALDVDYGAPTAEPLMHRVEQQAVTPIDAENTRYFFATGFKADIPEEILEPVLEIVKAAFAEDRAMIEAQQSIWDVTDRNKPMAFIEHDKAPAMFRRTLERLIKAEMSDEAVLSNVGNAANQRADVA